MTDRTDTQPDKTPAHAHPMRDWLSLELMLPFRPSLLDRVLDRFENEAAL